MSDWTIIESDCLAAMREMDDDSIDLIATDPPYFRVKDEAWDRQWEKAGQFIEWIGELATEWQRILRPNGTLYCFASPRMRARVELSIGEHFATLPTITWDKRQNAIHLRINRSACRSYFPASESIIVAEQRGSDSVARAEGDYHGRCDALRGFVFEPLRAYLDGERRRAGVSVPECNDACETATMAGHYFSRSQWQLPTPERYEKLRACFNAKGGEYLRREYEDLRREYEDLRRPFDIVPGSPFTDIWSFHPVMRYPGKHPCEKPVEMMRHIVETSSREGATVLDCFAGSGSTGVAAVQLGRRFIGIDQDARWCERARERLAAAEAGADEAGQLELSEIAS